MIVPLILADFLERAELLQKFELREPYWSGRERRVN
jgi:hypothetical protein